MESIIQRVADGEDLSFDEARSAADAVFRSATDAQIAGLLVALRAKGETDDEIAGLAKGMRDAAIRIDPDVRPLVDTCGTGGDRHDTFNISTTSAFVAAGAGVAVAKHGNHAVSSASGSADVLSVLDVDLEAAPDVVEAAVEEIGIGFLHAPQFHPSMSAVAGPRHQLAMRTVFNLLGPLTNPAGATAQVVGVYGSHLVDGIARALAQLDTERAMVVHGGGLDEIAVHDTTTVAELDAGRVRRYELDPRELGLPIAPINTIGGGTPEENALILRGILDGTIRDARRDIVLANAAAAIYVADETDSLAEGVEIAEQSIDDGHAAACLEAARRAQGMR